MIQDCKVSCENTISQRLKWLEVSNFIQVKHRKRKSNVYTIPSVVELDKQLNLEPTREPNCPYKKLAALWHEVLPEARPVMEWTDNRKVNMRYQWKKHPNLEWWKRLFEQIGESDFLMGYVQPKPDVPPFIISLGWLIEPENFAKVREGNYHG